MSTKIYNGLRGCVSDPFDLAASIRSVLEPVFFSAFTNAVDLAYDKFETSDAKKLTMGELWEVEEPFASQSINRYEVPKRLHDLIGRLHKSTAWTFSELDFAYEAVLLPNPTGANPLVMVFGEGAEVYRKMLTETGVVEPYPYWDNSDPEEGVTDEEWSQRSYAWTCVKDNAPSAVGLSISYPSAMDSELNLSKYRKTN